MLAVVAMRAACWWWLSRRPLTLPVRLAIAIAIIRISVFVVVVMTVSTARRLPTLTYEPD